VDLLLNLKLIIRQNERERERNKWNFQDVLKNRLTPLLRSQLQFSKQFESIMKRNKKNNKKLGMVSKQI